MKLRVRIKRIVPHTAIHPEMPDVTTPTAAAGIVASTKNPLGLSPPATQHTHILSSPLVAAQVQLADRIVIVEGTALEESDDAAIDTFVADYSAKYDLELQRRPPVIVTPTKILSWTIRGEAARDGFGVGGVWVPKD